MVIFDDIGSFPLPKGCSISGMSGDQYGSLVRQTMVLKVASGVHVPNYPQHRDMIRMFMDPISDPETSESPYLVRPSAAVIQELQAIDEMVASGFPDLRVRVCVTGPLELYLSAFGATAYTDILYNLAESVARFIRRAREHRFVHLASIDEPSLGINSRIVFNEEEISDALRIASEPCRGMDCEIHLHSPLYAPLCAHVSGINVIGVESAANPDYLKLIDRRLLEDTDTYLRAGIARTDILSMAAGLNERLGTNLWDSPAQLEREILALESPGVIRDRLDLACRTFGDRLRYAGPDCGLGSWPSREMAQKLLSACARAIF